MSNLRLIISESDTAFNNMAIDEALFTSLIKNKTGPALRIYKWDPASISIGYFQKYSDFSRNGTPLVRRMTGGLSVEHGKDVSYCFVVQKDDWPYLNDQEKTYEILHSFFCAAIKDMGIDAEFFKNINIPKTGAVCVNTFYPHDLHISGKKILGSCQRRRGNALIVHGAIHLGVLSDRHEEFANKIAKNFKTHSIEGFERGELSEFEKTFACELSRNKYSKDEWNKKY